MNRKLYSRMLLASTFAFLIQCSPGAFTSDNAPTNSGSNNSSSTGGGGTTSLDDMAARRKQLEKAISVASMTGYSETSPLASSTIPNVDFDRANGNFVIRVPMSLFGTISSLNVTFPDYPGMRLYVDYISSMPYTTLFIPVKYVLRNVTEVAAKLPNGNPVPLFPAGEPPSRAISLTPDKERKVYLYLSAEAFGLFAETSFDPLGMFNVGGVAIQVNDMMFTIKDKAGNPMGYFTFVGQKAPFKGGFFISHKIDPKLGKILDEYYIN
ncbi:MAG: hypothetical protein JNM24_10490 [Bdellovibrionaceae bacterium]|nr:hypothetical protein [Pseudobdellovibrionaceae bacterium]